MVEMQRRLKDEERAQFKMATQKPTTPLPIQQAYLQDYLEHQTKMQGEIDKKAALAMLRRDGVPQIYSKASTHQEQQGLMEPRSKLETSATERDIGGRLLAIDSTLMYQHPKKPDTSEEHSADVMPINHGDLL
jgi:GGDEF domain-containing protein